MQLSTAIRLIRPGVQTGNTKPKIWADLGAGTGMFTRALGALLPSGSKIYAIDKDRSSLESISWEHGSILLERIVANVTHSPDLPLLDGIIMGNVLHYIQQQREFLKNALTRLSTGGSLIIIEYDANMANRWVPYPVSLSQMKHLADGLGQDVELLGTERSRFNAGTLYSVRLQAKG